MRTLIAALAFSLAFLAGCASTQQAPHADGAYTASLDGKTVHYDDYATDKPGLAVVLVHGWASDNRVWKHNIPELSAHRRVLAVELPGHGRSDVPGTYSMDVFAAGIAAAMDDAGIQRAVLVGHSNGVPTIRQFYRNYPDRTAGLVCVDGTLKKLYSDEMIQPFIEMLSDEGYRETALGFMQQLIDASPLLTDEDAEDLRNMLRSMPQATLVGGMTAGADKSIWKTDEKIESPVLVINAASPFWSTEYRAFVDELVIGRPHEYHTWEGVSHMLMMEKPGEFNGLVIQFADMVSPPWICGTFLK